MNLSAEEKLHLSKCIWEEATFKKASRRAKSENPSLSEKGVTIDTLRFFSRTAEHWANVKAVREDVCQFIQDHPLVPGIDRIKILNGTLEMALERLESVGSSTKGSAGLEFTSLFLRLSTEIRHILRELREEAKLMLGASGLEGQEELSPLVRAVAMLQNEENLEERMRKLGLPAPDPKSTH